MSTSAGPSLNSAQMDAGAIGNIGKSVNLFRGDVTFPLNFLQLSGPNGLDVKCSATYSGAVANAVTTWNQDAPTGLLGLGWDLPIETIALADPDAASTIGAGFHLNCQGVSSRLVETGTTTLDGETCREFALAEHQPWLVRYFPASERWEVVQQNGTIYVYGGATTRGTLQYAVAFGNWVGNSAAVGGQSFVVAWNLAEVRDVWGNRLTFAYANDEVALDGQGGPAYTRASRLRTITDAYGRVVQYDYLPKEPSEYAPSHGRDRVGYQQRYDTQYLAAVGVTLPGGAPLLRVSFAYALRAPAPRDGEAQDAAPYVKRYLVSISETDFSGAVTPRVAFEYVAGPDATGSSDAGGATPVDAVGSLAKITYPQGGTASYRYGLNQFADCHQTATSPNGGVPRVWFGGDYIVVTWYDATGGDLVVTAYSWNGAWFPWSASLRIAVSLADSGSGLRVVAADDYFALSYVDAALMPHLQLFRKNPAQFGQWTSWTPNDSYAAVASDTAVPTAAPGDTFLLYAPGGDTLYRYGWDPRTQLWTSTTDTFQGDAIEVAVRANFYVVMAYDAASATGSMTLHFVDGLGNWGSLAFDETLSISANPKQTDQPWFYWSVGASFAVATFVAPGQVTASAVSTSLRIYSWDTAFSTIQRTYDTTTTVSMTLGLPPLLTIVAGALVGNLGNVVRYDGESWQTQSLPVLDTQQYGSLFAYAPDLAVAANVDGDVQGYAYDATTLAYAPVTLQNAPPNGSLPPRVTASGDFMTVGQQIYFRDAEKGWTALQTVLGGANQDTIENRAGSYIAYETGSGTSAAVQVLLIRNGDVYRARNDTLANQRIATGKQGAAGTLLCGSSAFVTYSAGITDFDTAPSLELYHVANGQIGVQRHFPVIGLDIDDGYEQSQTAYWYDAATATFDDSSTVAQYARVRTFAGVAIAPDEAQVSAAAASGALPFGFTETLYYNGLAADTPGLFYPGDTNDYPALLSGNPLLTREFSSTAELVSCRFTRENRFVPAAQPFATALKTVASIESTAMASAFTLARSSDVLDYLQGQGSMPAALSDAFAAAGYQLSAHVVSEIETPYESWLLVDEQFLNLYAVRANRSEITVIAGSCGGEAADYEPQYGLLRAASVFNRDVTGRGEAHVRALRYAWELTDGSDPLYPHLLATNQLGAVAEAVETVNGSVTAHSVTLYDGNGETSRAFSARATYQAIDAAASFDFAPGTTPDPQHWVCTQSITARDVRGQPVETRGADGLVSSTIFGADGAVGIVQASNASLAGGELAYYGAEAYETNPGWMLADGTAATVADGLAHTGSRCLALAAAAGNPLQLAIATLTPGRGNTRYVFSCRYRTEAAFAADAGSASLSAALTAGTASAAATPVALECTDGEWRAAHLVVDLAAAFGTPPASLSLTLAVTNAKASATIWLDELRFMPQIGSFSAQVFDATTLLPIAQIAENGEAIRSVYAGGRQPCATTLGDGSLVTLSTHGHSTLANGGRFSAAAPNASATVTPQGDGRYQDYRRRSDWTTFWSGATANWQVADAALRHAAAGTADTLTLIGAPDDGDLGLRLRVSPRSPLTQPLTLAYGALSVSWIPGASDSDAGVWRCNGDATGDVAPPVLGTLDARYAGVLEAGVRAGGVAAPALLAQLAGLGIALSTSGVTVSAVTAGAQWLLEDTNAAQRYRIDAGSSGLAVTCLTLPATELILLVTPAALTFFAGGQTVFQQALSAPASGTLTLTVSDAVDVADVLSFRSPGLLLSYADGCGRTRQSQAIENVPAAAGAAAVQNCLVSMSVYDAAGRPSITTKPVRYANALPGYRSSFITAVDPVTGALSGDCNDYYAAGGGGDTDDGGYPYTRNVYGNWPSAPSVQTGLPGAAFAVTGSDGDHTLRMAYTAHVAGDLFAALALPSGDYRCVTTTDADGNVTANLLSRTGQTLANAAVNGTATLLTTYDRDRVAGTLNVLPPAAQPGAVPAAAPLTAQFDFRNRLIESTQPDASAPSRYRFDRAGRLRAMQDANGAGAATPYLKYWKYDALGRCVENGTLDAAWPDVDDTAVDDPDWPAGGVWARRYGYDGGGLLGLGRLTLAQANNAATADAAPDVTERFGYDAQGHTVATQFSASAWGSASYTTGYAYDAQGRLRAVHYPDGETDIHYGYDSLNRLVSVGTAHGDASLGTFGYAATGLMNAQDPAPGATQSAACQRSANSPGWLSGLSSVGFTQTVSYDDGGSGYYNGRASGTSVAYGGSGAPSGYSYALRYDALSQLLSADCSGLDAGNLGTTTPLSYDANGNLQSLQNAAGSAAYTYQAGTNRVTAAGSAARYGYDANGAITSATQAGFAGIALASIGYDRYSGLATSFGLDAGTLTCAYDAHGRRCLKQQAGGAATLYLRASSGKVLVEYTSDGSGATPTACVYVQGPTGLLRLRRDGADYAVVGDLQGSARLVLDATSGDTVAQYDYGPFGDVIRSSGDTSLLRYLYTGQEYDPETGLYYYHARYYDSRLGRFYSQDPLADFPSPYCYVGNDPITRTDPTGLSHLLTNLVELVISGVEIALGLLLLFRPGFFGHLAGGALLGAGIHGLTYGIFHGLLGMGSFTTLGFLKVEGTGALFGAIGGLFRDGFGRLVKRPGAALMSDADAGAVGDASRATGNAASPPAAGPAQAPPAGDGAGAANAGNAGNSAIVPRAPGGAVAVGAPAAAPASVSEFAGQLSRGTLERTGVANARFLGGMGAPQWLQSLAGGRVGGFVTLVTGYYIAPQATMAYVAVDVATSSAGSVLSSVWNTTTSLAASAWSYVPSFSWFRS